MKSFMGKEAMPSLYKRSSRVAFWFGNDRAYRNNDILSLYVDYCNSTFKCEIDDENIQIAECGEDRVRLDRHAKE